MPHFRKGGRDEIEGPVCLIHLLPLFLFVLCHQVLLGRVVRLAMVRQSRLLGCDVNNSLVSGTTARPGVIQLLFFIIFLFILVPLDSPREQSVEYFIDLHLLPLRWHEVAFGRRMGAQGERVLVLKLKVVGRASHFFAGHFPAPNPIYKL